MDLSYYPNPNLPIHWWIKASSRPLAIFLKDARHLSHAFISIASFLYFHRLNATRAAPKLYISNPQTLHPKLPKLQPLFPKPLDADRDPRTSHNHKTESPSATNRRQSHMRTERIFPWQAYEHMFVPKTRISSIGYKP